MQLKNAILTVCFLGCFFVGAVEGVPQVKQDIPEKKAIVVMLPRPMDYNVIQTSVTERLSQLSNHKYWQASYVLGGLGLGVLTWYQFFSGSDDSSASGSSAATIPIETTEITEKDGTKKITIKKHGKQKETLGFWRKTARGSAKNAVNTFIFVLASALIASGQKKLQKLFYWFKTPNNVSLRSVLFCAAYNAFDSFVIRKKDGFLITDTEVIKGYNRVLRALQAYVVELSAQTIFLAQKEGVSVEDSVDLLLAQFSRDVDTANKKITAAQEPFVDEDARCGSLLNFALDTVGRIEDIYFGFIDEGKDEEEQVRRQHSESRSGRRG